MNLVPTLDALSTAFLRADALAAYETEQERQDRQCEGDLSAVAKLALCWTNDFTYPGELL